MTGKDVRRDSPKGPFDYVLLLFCLRVQNSGGMKGCTHNLENSVFNI